MKNGTICSKNSKIWIFWSFPDLLKGWRWLLFTWCRPLRTLMRRQPFNNKNFGYLKLHICTVTHISIFRHTHTFFWQHGLQENLKFLLNLHENTRFDASSLDLWLWPLNAILTELISGVYFSIPLPWHAPFCMPYLFGLCWLWLGPSDVDSTNHLH